MKLVIVEAETSQFSENPTKTWNVNYYVEYAFVECPNELDTEDMTSDELSEMADNEENGVRWSEQIPTSEDLKKGGFQ